MRNFRFEILEIIDREEACVARITRQWFLISFRQTLCCLSYKTWSKTIVGVKRFAHSQMRNNKCKTGKSFKYGIAREEEISRRKSETFKYTTTAGTFELNPENKEENTR